jgi:hypothetical protein
MLTMEIANDVMTYVSPPNIYIAQLKGIPKANLFYLALITERIPIIPNFIPGIHVGGHVPPIDFGTVFGLPRLRSKLGIPILEWHQVKKEDSEFLDDLGCWSVWESVNVRDPYICAQNGGPYVHVERQFCIDF